MESGFIPSLQRDLGPYSSSTQAVSPAGRAPEGMQAGPLSPPGVQAALQGLWGLRGGWKSELVLAWGTIRLSQGTARHHCKSRLH